jgi:hypothetical protein
MNEVLSTDLIAKMEAVKQACSERCIICKAGRGRMCLDVAGVPTYDGIHLQRRMLTEADDLLRAAYGR